MNSMDQTNKEKLNQLILKVERLEREKSEIALDVKEVFSEAKAFGYDTKIMKKVIALRKMEDKDREEMKMLTDLYMSALGST